MDLGEHSTLRKGRGAQDLVQLIVVADGQLEMARCNGLLLLLFGGIPSEFDDLTGEILEDGGHEDTGTPTNLGGVATLPEHTVAATHWEDQISSGRATYSGSLLVSLVLSWHLRT